MLKETNPILQKNRNNSFGALKLPKISSNFQKVFSYRIDNENTDTKKSLEIKLNMPKTQTCKKIVYNTLTTDVELVKNLDIDLQVDKMFPNNLDSHKLKESIDKKIK